MSLKKFSFSLFRALNSPNFRNIDRYNVKYAKAESIRILASACILQNRNYSSTDASSKSENDDVSETFINRNPRNLERMGIENKTEGWWLSYPRRDYWHKLVFQTTHRNTIAYVQHTNGNIVVSASTDEWAIRKHLYSATDVAAAENVGRVLAQRCLESGIIEMFHDTLETPVTGESITLFLMALTDAGISLEEKEMIVKEHDIGTDYDRQAEVGVQPTKRPWKKRNKKHWQRLQKKNIRVLPFETD